MSMFELVTTVVLVSAFPLLGGQAPQPTQPTKPDDLPLRKDDMKSEELLKIIIERGKQGIKTNAAQSALCRICSRPLHLHSEEGFVCKPSDATVQKIDYVKVTCPVCSASFQAVKPGNINAKGGRDRDFCPHSVGRYAVHATVSMCPDCGFAAQTESYLERSAKAPSRELVEHVRTKLTPPTRLLMARLAGFRDDPDKPTTVDQERFSQYVDQNSIPDWLKYGNALSLIEADLIRLPHGIQARLYCEAAHACRRFLSFELGSALENQQVMVSLGQTARRINDWLMAECIKARTDRLGENPDPSKQLTVRLMNAAHEPEIDPDVLLLGAKLLDRKIEEIIRIESQNPNSEQGTKVTRLDQYVFHLRYAGIMDRVGDLNGAVDQLEKAQACIPKELPATPQPMPPEAKAKVEKILGGLKAISAERIDLVNRERQYLFRAADHLMQALYFEEQARNLDPALNCYLIGEMLRRSEGEPAAAFAWFNTAKQLFQRIEPEKSQPQIPAGTDVEEAAAIRQHAVATLEEKKRVMLAWTEEQQRLVQSKAVGKEPDTRIKAAIAKVLASSGVNASLSPEVAAVLDPRIPEKEPNDQGPKPPAVTKAETAPVKGVLTREGVLKRYHAALLSYVKQNGAPPKNLKDLVTAGMLSQADSCLDEQGRLLCPETGGQLNYVPPAAMGPHNVIIVPSSKDANRNRLFADGQVGEK
jgi:tetratricopeptide (TPR) repeat protein